MLLYTSVSHVIGVNLFDWIKKTELGVKRSKEAWFNKVARLFAQGTIREEIWGELEELLISADVGVETTTKLLDRVKPRVKMDKVAEALQVKSTLKKEMVNLLSFPNSPCHSEPFAPSVIASEAKQSHLAQDKLREGEAKQS